MSNEVQKNVFGEPLEPCSNDPVTGWFRDGCCNTDKNDRGVHTVCAKVTDKFLLWSKKVGNDLITPHPEFGETFSTKYFRFTEPGKIKWGHDGKSFNVVKTGEESTFDDNATSHPFSND